jgi:sugar lactone lactonase YvrE
VVYTPDTKPYYCVEPVSHVPNAIHMSDPAAHGLRALAPQATMDAWMKIEVSRGMTPAWAALPVAPSLLGESPFWHPDEAALYWCDIPGKALHRWHAGQRPPPKQWAFDTEPAAARRCPVACLLLAMRDGLFRFDPASGQRQAPGRTALRPGHRTLQRRQGRRAGPLWVGTIYEPRTPPKAALYRWAARPSSTAWPATSP